MTITIFKDISNFNNINDYLPILNAALNTVLLVMFLILHKYVRSYYLEKWYKTFHLSSIIENVTTLMCIVIATRYIYKNISYEWNIFCFTLLAVIVMMIYDISFYLVFTYIPKGYSRILDFFKKYKSQLTYKNIGINSIMIIFTCLLSSYFSTLDNNMNIITLISTLFFIPYLLYLD
jgi:hypothetical protein